MIDCEAAAREWIAERADTTALDRLDQLEAMLRAENQVQNLVSEASLSQVWQRHFADCAQLLNHVPRETIGPWLDLGSGAGFPALVIAVLRPELEMVAVESRARRIDWLQRASAELGLDRFRVDGRRLERVESFAAAVISARAFAPLDRSVALSARFSTGDTTWVLPKGRSARDEVERLSGWRHTFHVEQSLTDPEAGIVVGTLVGSSITRKASRT